MTQPESKPKRYTKHTPRRIKLPDGDVLWPRAEFCRKVIGVTERTARNLGLPNVLIGGVAYTPHDKALWVIASRIRHAPEPHDVGTRSGHRRVDARVSAKRSKP